MIITSQTHFKFDNHERVLAYLLEKVTDAKVGRRMEDIFMRYL